MPAIETRFLDLPARSLVTMPTELSRITVSNLVPIGIYLEWY